jgi:hypothetical protein
MGGAKMAMAAGGPSTVNVMLIWIGRIAGVVGVLVGIGAVVARAVGLWHVGGLSSGTLLLAGVAVMVVGILAYVAALAERNR